MKTHKTRNAVLALTALAALSIYIMACTSFSPDDSKVLYPAFDAESGAIGMAVYDREAKRSEMILLPVAYEGTGSNTVALKLMRGQWLDDGRGIVIGYAVTKDYNDDGMNLALLPSGAKGPVKLFRMPNAKDAGPGLLFPLCVVGERVFLNTGSKEVVRLDLKTGALTRHEFEDAKKEVDFYSSPGGKGLFYFEPQEEPAKGAAFGRVNPEDFSRTQLMMITNEIPDKSIPAFDSQGKALAFLETAGETNRLLVLRPGKPVFTRTFGAKGEEQTFGSAGISPQGDMLWATFEKKAAGTNTASYGLIEIPFSNGAIRETTLLAGVRAADENAAFFQGSLSHDGKTVAVASTYLACNEKGFDAGDCALFLVDLSTPERKVTKVPIPLPAKRSAPAGK